MPGRAGLAPRPSARLSVKVEELMRHETPMLLSAEPLLHLPARLLGLLDALLPRVPR